MSDFLGGSEIAARTQMLGMNNSLAEAKISAQRTEKTDSPEYMAQIKKVSRDFESIFLGYLLKQMKATVPEDPLFGQSIAKDIFTDMRDEAISKELAKAGGIGLAAMLYKQLSTIKTAATPITGAGVDITK
ncbi:MAG: rod-binding protein [Spirochaetia bacterium]|nr:rod-binding protein [Spirochaetia bacterium]